MKYSMNMLLWTSDVTEADFPIVEQLKEIGYDGIELPFLQPVTEQQAATLGKQLDDLGMGRTAVAIQGPDTNPISPDAAVRKRGVDAIRATLDTCATAGVELLVGPLYAALAEFTGMGPTEDEWKWGVESVRQMAEHAGQAGVRIAIEPLNRFEIYFLTTQADAARFVREVNHPACCTMHDTFHANIEEKSIAAALDAGADLIGHVHICANDRSTPGAGSIDWESTFDGLHRAGYDGWLTVEAFGRRLPDLAGATKIWRTMFDSEMQLATDALSFMQAEVARRWS